MRQQIAGNPERFPWRGRLSIGGSGLTLALLLLGGCTIDLTDPPLTGDGPARIAIAFTVLDLEGEEGCWSVAVAARPLLRDGRLAPVPDSAIRLAGELLAPGPRPHSLASFTYRSTPRCGERPESVSLEIPYLDGLDDLGWPLGSLPMPWRGGAAEEVVERGGTADLRVPLFAVPLDLPGERRLDWTARVARAPDAPEDQEDHQLLTNSSESSGIMLSIGAPFTSVAGTLWEVRWGAFSRLDRTTPSERLQASLEYRVVRVSRLRVVEGEG